MSVGLGSRVWRREKANKPMGQRCGAPGGILGGPDEARHVVVAALADTRLQQVQASGDPGEQVVEIVRDAAGELADRFHLL